MTLERSPLHQYRQSAGGMSMSDEGPVGGIQPPGTEGGIPGTGGQAIAAASLGVRIGARLLDVLLVGIPAAIVFGLIGLSTVWSGVILSLLWFGYFVWFESNQGATVGKKLLNIRVVGMDGSFPAMEVAAKRNIWMLFGLIPIIGGLLQLIAVIAIIVTISSSTDNRGYHDTFAGTRVLR
jgi:uncharacterized RDD family membrane protein YckC